MIRVAKMTGPALTFLLEDLSPILTVALGGLALLLAAGVAATGMAPAVLAARLYDWVGPVFLLGLAGLGGLAGLAVRRLGRNPGDRRWRSLGLAAASAIATLALTFTLFGISVGIAGLAAQPLTPETVGQVVPALTERFGLAFATTVIGLPLSAALRAAVAVSAEPADTNPD